MTVASPPRSSPPRSSRPVRVPLTNTRERYGRVAQAFHWTIALLFLLQYPGGIIASELPETARWISTKVWLFSAHKTVGVVIFALALARIAWAIANPHPRLLNAERVWEARAAATIHWLLYAAILLVPLSGMAIHWTTTGYAPLWLPFPEHIGLPTTERAAAVAALTHNALTITVLGAIALHVGGALKHHLIDRDATLRRMLPWAVPRLGAIPPPSMQPRFVPTFALGAGALVLAGSVGAGIALSGVLDARALDVPATAAVDRAPAIEDAVRSDGAGAPQWAVVPEASELAITIEQLGSPVQGRFEVFDANIRFDPDRLDRSRIDVAIDLRSLTLGTVSDQGKTLLGASNAPTARFTADAFQRSETGYLAQGELTLAGASAPVSLPFELAINGNRASVAGTAVLDRLDWGVGATDYPDGGSLGLDVRVEITLEAVREDTGAADVL